jgi:hypothetical protein
MIDFSASPKDNQLSSNQYDNFNTIDTLIPARVLDVILDESYTDYQSIGGANSLGAIRYKLLTSDVSEDSPEEFGLAFPISTNIKHLPLKNEIVLIGDAPSDNLQSDSSAKRKYYHSVVGIWNHPQYSAYPSNPTDELDQRLDLGPDIEGTYSIRHNDSVQRLQPFPGDIIIEGRQGQSIRLSGYNHPKSTISTQLNQGFPYTYLVNGRKAAGDDPTLPVVEDINLDDSSIVLTSNHKVPLSQSAEKYDTYPTAPPLAKDYSGNQVVINSGRLFFNSNKENIALSANQSVSATANTSISLDAGNYIGLDAPVVLLGTQESFDVTQGVGKLKPLLDREPAVLGHKLEEFLVELLDVVQEICEGLSDAQTKQGSPLGELQEIGARNLRKVIEEIKPAINPGRKSKIKSNKVFIE